MSRAKRSALSDWWWTTDRTALVAVIALLIIGLVLAFAASPAATGGPMTEGDFRYALKQIAFAAVAVGLLAVTSVMTPRSIKVASAAIWIVALALCVVTLFAGSEVLGAKRWLNLGWMTLQPSEFLKPSFAVLASAILADGRRLVLPKPLVTFLLLAPALVILLLQPDVGQTALLLALWAGLLFFNGASLRWMGALGGSGAALGGVAYLLIPHVHHRFNQFFDPHEGGYQPGLALKAFARGGLTGVGPGAGSVKYHLPTAQSDFIFAVAGEEFGILLCGLIVILFCVLSVRLLLRSARIGHAFSALAGAGLASVMALQAFINMGVAVSLLPTKGMTLPFISYGGSSLFAIALTMGFALALTRQRSKIGETDIDLFAFLREPKPA